MVSLVSLVCPARVNTRTFSTMRSRVRPTTTSRLTKILHYKKYTRKHWEKITPSWSSSAVVCAVLVAQPGHQTIIVSIPAPKSRKRQLTRIVGYSTKTVPPTIQPHFTSTGKGSWNIPWLHLVITNSSVKTVASNSQQCCPMRLAFLSTN